jgi:L-ectoine synthase
MLIRTMDQLEAEGRVISISHGRATAVRLLTKSDGVGFSVSEARASQAGQSDLWYKHHWEANYVRSGRAVLEDRSTGERWQLEPGVLYCVGPRDRHRIIRDDPTDMRIISVFNPPIEGEETHDEDGAYPPTGEIPPGRERMFVKTLSDVRRAGLERTVAGGAAVSARYLTADDHLGFSLTSVRLQVGAEADLWYKHHWETNLVLDGTLEVTDDATGDVHRLGPGGLYLVGPKDRHHVKALTDLHAISVFNPPLTGAEDHDADGSYPPTGPVPPGPRGV